MQIARHAPGLKLEVYGGLRWHRRLAADMDAKERKSKRKKQVCSQWEAFFGAPLWLQVFNEEQSMPCIADAAAQYYSHLTPRPRGGGGG